MNNIRYERNLVHIHPVETPLFITFRLHNSIPAIVYQNYAAAHRENSYLIEKSIMDVSLKKELLYTEQKKLFKRMEDYIHNESSVEQWLLIPEIGQLVHDKILSFHEERYNLICSCVMPNHVHILLEHYLLSSSTTNNSGKDRNYPVAQTMRYIKGNTARKANSLLKREGAFWQHESYDHYIRNDQELQKVIAYILNNPVKAGLVKSWTEWTWTYLAGH